MYQSPPEQLYLGWKSEIDEFIRRFRQLHYYCPMRVTSWWRDYAHNLSVGGDEYSQHLIATAADVQPIYHSVEQLCQMARHFGLVAVAYPRHAHLQLHGAGYLSRYAFAH